MSPRSGLVSAPLWSTLKYLNKYQILIALNMCTDVYGSRMMNPKDFNDPLTFHPRQQAWQHVHQLSKIEQILLDRLAQNVVWTFMVPR